MKFSIKDFFSKCHQSTVSCRFGKLQFLCSVRDVPDLFWTPYVRSVYTAQRMKKSLMENFTFCAVLLLVPRGRRPWISSFRTSPPEMFYKKGACTFIKKETLEQVFSCEFCEIFKNTFSYRTPPVAVSVAYVLRDRYLMVSSDQLIRF